MRDALRSIHSLPRSGLPIFSLGMCSAHVLNCPGSLRAWMVICTAHRQVNQTLVIGFHPGALRLHRLLSEFNIEAPCTRPETEVTQ